MCYFIEYLWKEGLIRCLKQQNGLINIILSWEKQKRHTCRTVKTATKNNKLVYFCKKLVNLSKERSVFIKMFIKMFISKEYVEKSGKNKKINLSINSCQFTAVVFLLQNSD